ncbi:NUDIX hydrolase [Moorena sp. SIO3H5]|uniref:NUDIX domain-containing protein n=1 Tax=Moorena sp. SIO3H5 TaxID=2607834 RepID=UPI0013B6F86A|nr:NUDIX hydrolase [Moorena sp. SIO3H5]NEO71484.1 NUDIX hydrolase [Moorena sp. SIO3H5]
MNPEFSQDSDNPFTRISSKIIYQNPWMDVVEDVVKLPSGKENIYGKIINKSLSVGIIPLDYELNTWIVGQFRYAIQKYSWEIPIGGGLFSVPPIETAKRELKEETGLKGNNWRELLRLNTSIAFSDELAIVYVATDLEIGNPCFDETEKIRIKKLPFSEVIDMVTSGEIVEAISVASLLLLVRQLNL